MWGWPAAILAVSILISCWPLLAHGPLPQGSDVFASTHYTVGFMKAFGEGDWYPRWTDRTNQFLGAPSFIMLPPMPWITSAFTAWLSGSLVTGYKLFFILITIASALSFHLLARDWTGDAVAAALGAGIYILLPYRLLDLYHRFALSETMAFIFTPLVLLYARRCIRRGSRGAYAGLALSYAALLATHVITALMLSILLGPWMLWEARRRWLSLIPAGLAIATGLGLASPVLLPAVLEKEHANISWVREMPNGDYRANFIFLDEPMPILGFKNPIKPMILRDAHSQLLLGAVAAFLALAWLSRKKSGMRGDVWALAAGCGLTYFLQVRLSRPLWEIVPELPTIQFPFRFQALMVLTAALLAAFAVRAAWPERGRPGLRPPRRRAVGVAVLAVVVLVNLNFAWKNAHDKPFTFVEGMARRQGVVDWVEPAFTPVEFLPYKKFRWGMRVEMDRTFFQAGRGTVNVRKWESSTRSLDVETATGGTVGIRSFWFPGWVGRLDGRPLELHPLAPYGVVTFDVPPGRHRVELEFVATPVRRAAWIIALATLLLAGILAWLLPRLAARTAPGELDAGDDAEPART